MEVTRYDVEGPRVQMGFYATPDHALIANRNQATVAGPPAIPAADFKIDDDDLDATHALGAPHGHPQDRRRVVLCDEPKPESWTAETDPDGRKRLFRPNANVGVGKWYVPT